MKKLISIFGLVVFLAGGMTAFAVPTATDDEIISGVEDCPNGSNIETGECKPAPDTTPPVVDYSQKIMECKTFQDQGMPVIWNESTKKCENLCSGKEMFDPKAGACVDRQTYMDGMCKEANPNFLYDINASKCYDPNVEQGTLLPSTDLNYAQCDFLMKYGKLHQTGDKSMRSIVEGGKIVDVDLSNFGAGTVKASPLDVLACGIKTGEINLWMIPFYIKYLIQFLLSIAGLMAILSIILGGYFYMFSGISEDKERGKKAIMYGIAGFVFAITSWAIVNIVLSILTR